MTRKIPARNIRMKRAYEPPATGDGVRVLVDRLWPRSVGKDKACIDRWFKEIAPSTALRKWFGHDSARWREFRRRYRAELRGQPGRVAELRAIARRGAVTLVFAARDELHNDAVVLRHVLLGDRRGAFRCP